MAILETGAIQRGGGPSIIYYDDPAAAMEGFPDTDAVLSPREINFSFTTLGTTSKVYTCSSKEDAVALMQFYAPLGAKLTLNEGPVFTLKVEVPWDEFANLDTGDTLQYAIWEVIPHEIEKSIFDVGIYSPNTANGLISTKRVLVNLEQKAAIDYAAKNPSYDINLAVSSDPDWIANAYIAENYLALLRLKAPSILGFTCTLKRSVILNKLTEAIPDPINQSGTINGWGNVVVCTNDMIEQYNIPSIIQPYLFPSWSRIRTMPLQDPVTLFGFAGWISKAPTIQQLTPGKAVHVQEFIWDEWIDASYQTWQNAPGRFPSYTDLFPS